MLGLLGNSNVYEHRPSNSWRVRRQDRRDEGRLPRPRGGMGLTAAEAARGTDHPRGNASLMLYRFHQLDKHPSYLPIMSKQGKCINTCIIRAT